MVVALSGGVDSAVLLALAIEALGPDRAILMPDGATSYFDESMLDLVALA